MFLPTKAALAAGLVLFSTVFAAAAPAVVSTNLKMRSGPGQNFAVLTTMPAGAAIDATGCDAGWCRILFAGRAGFADVRYISFGGPGVVGAAPAPVVVGGPVVVGYPYPCCGYGYYGYGPRWGYGRGFYGRRRW